MQSKNSWGEYVGAPIEITTENQTFQHTSATGYNYLYAAKNLQT